MRVAKDDAFAAVALDAELARAKLAPRDIALATEITYGTLRSLVDIDAQLARFLTKPAASLDENIRAILRTGAYQILYLSRIPVHSAVDESVNLASQLRGKKLGGLVNAILRKVTTARPENPAPPLTLSLPLWLRKELNASLGQERADRFVSERTMPLPISIRVQTDRISRDAYFEKLSAKIPDAIITQGTLSDRVLLVQDAGDPRAWPGYAEGEFAVQDEGSVVIAEIVGAQKGERVLDACAGRGGKTMVLAGDVGSTGHVTAADVYPEKLEKMLVEGERLGVDVSRIELVGVDLAVGAGGLTASFDRVLVDAPCTGLGTVHRRPEILLRLSEKDLTRMAALQTQIVSRAATLVRPGGVLVYSVCSPTKAEGIEVVRHLLEKNTDLKLDSALIAKRGMAVDADQGLRLGPWSSDANGPDAYQVFSFRRLS
jgi:16S rRNA (cytosine967-C5)-methyltransferase